MLININLYIGFCFQNPETDEMTFDPATCCQTTSFPDVCYINNQLFKKLEQTQSLYDRALEDLSGLKKVEKKLKTDFSKAKELNKKLSGK